MVGAKPPFITANDFVSAVGPCSLSPFSFFSLKPPTSTPIVLNFFGSISEASIPCIDPLSVGAPAVVPGLLPKRVSLRGSLLASLEPRLLLISFLCSFVEDSKLYTLSADVKYPLSFSGVTVAETSTICETEAMSSGVKIALLVVFLKLALSASDDLEPPNIRELLPDPATPTIALRRSNDPSLLAVAANLDRCIL